MTLKTHLLACAATLAMALPAHAERELTLGMQDNEASNVYAGTQEFAARLEEASGGELTVNIFPSSTLGDFKAMVAQVQAGELDMVITGYPDMSYIIPELNLIGAPYVADDFDHLKEIIAGDWGQEMAAKFEENGVHLLDVWYYGTRQTTANRAIESMDDMEGLRIRTPNVPFLIAYAENTGGTAAPVAFAEVYLALQTNQVDAQENPLPTIEAMKFYEVQSHVAMTNHFVASAAVQISNDLWDSLSDEEKGWIQEAVEAGGEVNNSKTIQAEEDLIATFEERGLTITRPDLAPFREAMQPYYDTLEAEFGEGAIARVRGE
ncbi:sialic acid TRAP transporter substrate-binding protein SiaP [Thalassorhabdomicrobium marinisediminis]|uniref:C4-dicarboxylate ABC transporter substrate-binding protein n=1 Tax=Thalassorhabdomicrobium marinisediminis TaxID=2170577 RepID=A0A2T7FUQ0_9RHOB|nr:sialic acid TRAP transporter substrate-binding protein SiaP [Thalassorhabdomicrobium marinisediminis]PVA05885.1 C4-dicarboxylate ABC transporter substrate-binding protein [Thalassorhabdomicrobium marinisediminis]